MNKDYNKYFLFIVVLSVNELNSELKISLQ